MYNTEAEALNGMTLLEGDGWQALACCDPARGVVGLSLFKLEPLGPPLGAVETSCLFEWPLYGKELKPEAETVDAEGLLKFLREEPEVWQCDDAKRCLYGFVSYRRAEEGVSMIRYARRNDLLKVVKNLEGFKQKSIPHPSGEHVSALAVTTQEALAARFISAPAAP